MPSRAAARATPFLGEGRARSTAARVHGSAMHVHVLEAAGSSHRWAAFGSWRTQRLAVSRDEPAHEARPPSSGAVVAARLARPVPLDGRHGQAVLAHQRARMRGRLRIAGSTSALNTR